MHSLEVHAALGEMLADLTARPVVTDEVEELDVQTERVTAQGDVAAGLPRPFADRTDTDRVGQRDGE